MKQSPHYYHAEYLGMYDNTKAVLNIDLGFRVWHVQIVEVYGVVLDGLKIGDKIEVTFTARLEGNNYQKEQIYTAWIHGKL